MSNPERASAKLADALARFEALRPKVQVDETTSEADARRERTDRLHRLGITLHRSVHDNVLSNRGLLETISLCAVRDWLLRDDLPPVIIVVGCSGCGKSVTSAVAAVNFNGSVKWTTGPDLVRLAAASFGPEAHEFRQLKGAELAIVDDAHTAGNPERECAALIEFIDARKRRKSIITSNLAQHSRDPRCETWETRFTDPRLHSRLKESAVFVYDDGPDLRGRA